MPPEKMEIDPQDIEIDVVKGYRSAGVAIVLCTLLGTAGPILFGIKSQHASWVPVLLAMMATLLVGVALCFTFSRIRFSPHRQQAVIEKGVGRYVSRRTEDLSGEKRFVIRSYQNKNGQYLKISMELANGRRFLVLSNVSPKRFKTLAEAAPLIGARFVLANPVKTVPKWFRPLIDQYRIELI